MKARMTLNFSIRRPGERDMRKINLGGTMLVVAASSALMLAGCQKKADAPAATSDAAAPAPADATAPAAPAPAAPADAAAADASKSAADAANSAATATGAVAAKRNSDQTGKQASSVKTPM